VRGSDSSCNPPHHNLSPQRGERSLIRQLPQRLEGGPYLSGHFLRPSVRRAGPARLLRRRGRTSSWPQPKGIRVETTIEPRPIDNGLHDWYLGSSFVDIGGVGEKAINDIASPLRDLGGRSLLCDGGHHADQPRLVDSFRNKCHLAWARCIRGAGAA